MFSKKFKKIELTKTECFVLALTQWSLNERILERNENRKAYVRQIDIQYVEINKLKNKENWISTEKEISMLKAIQIDAAFTVFEEDLSNSLAYAEAEALLSQTGNNKWNVIGFYLRIFDYETFNYPEFYYYENPNLSQEKHFQSFYQRLTS